MERFERTKRLIGNGRLKKLKNSKVLIVGVGGVGSYAAEAIARAGIGTIAIMDGDRIALSNINRQLIALEEDIGKSKANVMGKRIKSINPDAKVIVIREYYSLKSDIRLADYDYIIDAIDSIKDKIDLIESSINEGVRIISSMGTAGKIYNDSFKIADIYESSVCPLARKVRKELRARGIKHLKVVYSTEKTTLNEGELGTISYVPGVAGLMIAGEVIRELGGIEFV